MPRKRKIFDIGQRFGMGVIIADMKIRDKHGHYRWLLQCDCGNKYESPTGRLNAGDTKSCGCKRCTTGKGSHAWQGCGDIPLGFFNSFKIGAGRRDKEFSITIEDVRNQWEKQKGKCAYTGEDLTFGVRAWRQERTASLDRIDNSKGYVLGNIEFCHKHINLMKHSFEKEHFIKMCKLVGGGV